MPRQPLTPHGPDERLNGLLVCVLQMIDDQDLGFFANFLGVTIFILVVAYHYVVADPKFDPAS